MATFDDSILDENSRASYEQRRDLGLEALALVGEDEETDPTDIISDILTAVVGPAGTYSFTEGDTRYEPRTRLAAIRAAQSLLDRALCSWQGDAEDYIEGRAPEPGEYGYEAPEQAAPPESPEELSAQLVEVGRRLSDLRDAGEALGLFDVVAGNLDLAGDYIDTVIGTIGVPLEGE